MYYLADLLLTYESTVIWPRYFSSGVPGVVVVDLRVNFAGRAPAEETAARATTRAVVMVNFILSGGS